MKMNKIIILILTMFCMSIAVNAVTLDTNQDDNLEDFYLSSQGNVIIDSVAGSRSTSADSDNDTAYYQELDGGGYFYFDYKYEIEEVNEDFYIILNNIYTNQNITFFYRGDTNRDPTMYRQDITLTEVGRYIFKFEPDYINEPVVIYFNASDSFAGTIRYVEDKPQSFNDVVGFLVTSFDEVISINIGIWKVTFYLILLIITTGFIFLLFYIGFKIFDYAKNIRNNEGFHDSYQTNNHK